MTRVIYSFYSCIKTRISDFIVSAEAILMPQKHLICIHRVIHDILSHLQQWHNAETENVLYILSQVKKRNEVIRKYF